MRVLLPALLACCLLLAVAPAARATLPFYVQQDEVIFRDLQGCLENVFSAPDTVLCYITAKDRADALLNDVYGQLVGVMQPHQQEMLRNAQLAWIPMRDADVALAAALTQGSLAQILAAQADYARTRQRALDLGELFTVMTEELAR